MAKQRAGLVAAKTWTAKEARAVLEAWEKSGESGAAFARSIGVVAQRLFWWRRRLGHGAPSGRTTFVPVVATTTAQPGHERPALVVTTARGARIEVHEVDAATAAWVAAVLGEGVGS